MMMITTVLRRCDDDDCNDDEYDAYDDGDDDDDAYDYELHDSLPDLPVTPISPTTSRNISIGFQSLLALNTKFSLLFLRPKWGWHLHIFVTPSDFRPLPHPFILLAPWIGGSFMSLGVGQLPWPCVDLLPLLPLLFGIAFHPQLVLLSYHPIFLRPYHFLKLVSFLGANLTKSASVC